MATTSVISELSALSDDATLVSGGTATHTEHNTHRTTRQDQINSLRLIAIQLEVHYSGASAPTDTPNGKIWGDSGNNLGKLRVSSAWETLGRSRAAAKRRSSRRGWKPPASNSYYIVGAEER